MELQGGYFRLFWGYSFGEPPHSVGKGRKAKQRKGKESKEKERKGKETKIGEESNSEALLDPFWSHLGPCRPSWAYFGSLLGQFEAILDNLRPSWAILGHLGSKSFQDSVRINLPVAELRHLGPFWIPFWGQKLAIF